MQVVFVSSNKEKLREVKEILGDRFEIVNKDIDLLEIQDIHSQKVATQKAQLAFETLKTPLFVEDTSLYINCWNGLPGAFNKWFIKTIGNEGILKMLKSFENRKAVAETTLAYHNGKKVITFSGMVRGAISDKIKGVNGFGWDKIFIPDGAGKTQAELTSSEKNKISTRRKALEKLKKYLLKNEK